MIDPGHPRLSIVRQCELASISRSSFYREPTAENEETLRLMRLIDEQFLETPWYGSRQMARHLRRNGWCVGRHRVRRLMLKMGLAPIYRRPKTSEPHPQHRIWPYLLRHLSIERPNQVWCADVTYIPLRRRCRAICREPYHGVSRNCSSMRRINRSVASLSAAGSR